MRVFVKNQRNEPLMPCEPRKARLLLKEKKAKIVGYKPFTIQLLYATGETVQEMHLGIDSGAKYVGVAVVSEDKILAKGEIELRQDATELLEARKTLRRSRRNRNTRYRRCKFKYKTSRVYDAKKKKYVKRKIAFESPRSEGWLPPSIQSRADNQIFWTNKFASLLPNPKVTVEVGKFDVQRMMNPDIAGAEYQQSDAYGFWAIRYYVFARDNYTCQICKKKGGVLQTHHVIQRKDGGSDRADNLATVHMECHENFHQGLVKHTFKKPKSYKETAFMNALRKQMMKRLDCAVTYGNVTTADRKALGLAKSHANDAIAISGAKKLKGYAKAGEFVIKQFRKKKRSLHESIPRKGRKEPNRTQKRNEKNTKCQDGFWLNDRVEIFGKIGYVSGFCQGGMYVKSIEGDYITVPGKTYKQVPVKVAKFLCHNNNWQYKQKRA